MPKKPSKAARKTKKGKPKLVQEHEINSVLDKLEHFRRSILNLSQAKVAEKISLSQNVVHRIEKGRGSISSFLSTLFYYYLVHGLDVNSLFDSHQELKNDPSSTNPSKKINFKTEKNIFYQKLEKFRKGIIRYTQLQVCEDLGFTQNMMHRLEKGSGVIPEFIKLIIYYQQIHSLNITTAFDKNVPVLPDPNRITFMNLGETE